MSDNFKNYTGTSPFLNSSNPGTNLFKSGITSVAIINFCLAFLYYAAGKLSLQFTFYDSFASAFYLPAGLSVVLNIILGQRYAPSVFLGTLALNIEGLAPIPREVLSYQVYLALAAALASCLQGVTAAYLLRRYLRPREGHSPCISSTVSCLLLAFCCVPASFCGSAFTHFGLNETAPIGQIANNWWAGDFSGIMLSIFFLEGVTSRELATPKCKKFLIYIVFWLSISLSLHTANHLLINLAGTITSCAMVSLAAQRLGYRKSIWLILAFSFSLLIALKVDGDVTAEYYSTAFFPVNLVSMYLCIRVFTIERQLKEPAACQWLKHTPMRDAQLKCMQKHSKLPALLLISAIISAATISVKEYQEVQSYVLQTANRIANLLKVTINAPLTLQEQQGLLWEHLNNREAYLRSHAKYVTTTFRYVTAYSYLDESLNIRLIEAQSSNEYFPDFNPHTDPKRKETLKAASGTGHSLISPIIRLRQGGIGFVTVSQLYSSGICEGYTAQTFKLSDLMSEILQVDVTTGKYQFLVDFFEDANLVYSSSADPARAPNYLCADKVLTIRNSTWKIRVSPSNLSSILPLWRASNLLLAGSLIFGPILGAFQYLRDLQAQREIIKQIDAKEQVIAQKENLIQEVHHRVKNNLQIVSGLLSMQLRGCDSPLVSQQLFTARGRIASMALLHEFIYNAKDCDSLNLAKLIKELSSRLSETFSLEGKGIIFQIQSTPRILISEEQSAPVVLILNELITNSIKHAFTGKSSGSIIIQAKLLQSLTDGNSDRIMLEIIDNGIGMQQNEISGTVTGLGGKIIFRLAKQIGATLELAPQAHGTRWVLILPSPAEQKAV
jgi:two-component sensor histidine kinase